MFEQDLNITSKIKNFARKTWDKVNCAKQDDDLFSDSMAYNPDADYNSNQTSVPRQSQMQNSVTYGRKSSWVTKVSPYQPMASVVGTGQSSKFSKMSISSKRNTTATNYDNFRSSVAVVECPIASLCGDMHLSKEESCLDKKISITGYGSGGTSVNAFEVMPASPIKDELIEIYVITEYVIKEASKINTLIKFMSEVDDKNVFILVASNEEIDSALLQKLRVTAVYSPNMFEQYDTKNIKINVIGLKGEGDYIRNGIEMVETVRASCSDDNMNDKSITIALADCSTRHCKNLVEDINDIHVIIPTGKHETSKIMTPKGVPIICIDKDSVGHITIGFDDYNQYDIRRTENIKYYDYLGELGLLDFMEEDEDQEW